MLNQEEMMLASGMTRAELEEILDEIAAVLEDEDLTPSEKVAEIEEMVLGDAEDDED
jgi:hypothetical protein